MYLNRFVANRQRERGAVLIVAMIFLIIMTLLAVTGMTTTSLEEKMASNSQESSRAFQAAETGLARALQDTNSYDLTGTYSVPVAEMFTDSDLDTEYGTDRLGDGGIPLELNNTEYASDVGCYDTANFDLISTGSTAAGITVTIHGGAWQIKKLAC